MKVLLVEPSRFLRSVIGSIFVRYNIDVQMAESGILRDFGLTQVLQGNAHGGKDTNNAFRYSGSVDFTPRLDTARMAAAMAVCWRCASGARRPSAK